MRKVVFPMLTVALSILALIYWLTMSAEESSALFLFSHTAIVYALFFKEVFSRIRCVPG